MDDSTAGVSMCVVGCQQEIEDGCIDGDGAIIILTTGECIVAGYMYL